MQHSSLRIAAALIFAAVAGCSDSAPTTTTAPDLAPTSPSMARKPTTSPLVRSVTGTVEGGRTFAGSFATSTFRVINGQLMAVGTLTGTITDGSTVVGTVSQALALPVVIPQASCEILNLELGPLDLNLLGLEVHLDRIVLNITAQPGPGNLLGNLLCAIANLLNGGGALTSIAALLNQLLDALAAL